MGKTLKNAPYEASLGSGLTPHGARQTEAKQGSLPGTGPNPNEIDGSSDGVYYAFSPRFEDDSPGSKGLGEGQIHCNKQMSVSQDQYPYADGKNLGEQEFGSEEVGF